MRVWFYPCDEPNVYAILRPDAETTIVLISDGLPLDWAACAAGALATKAERDWARKRMGLPTVDEDPTYTAIDKVAGGSPVWDRSMIPADMLWEGALPDGELSTTAVGEVASDRTS